MFLLLGLRVELVVFFVAEVFVAWAVLADLVFVSPAAKTDGAEIAAMPKNRNENNVIFPRNVLLILI